MTRIAKTLAILGALMLGFSWWGQEAEAGRHRFDEMAGMIPFGSGVAGLFVLLVSGAMMLIRGRQRDEDGGHPDAGE